MASEHCTTMQSHTHAPRPSGMAMGAACLVLVFAASAAPIPLYGLYREALGLSGSNLSLITVAYFLGTIGSLLVFARLSDHLGRRPAIALALGLSIAGCLLFARPSSFFHLMAGRLMQGLACGIASGSAGAYVVDSAPEHRRDLAAVITSSSPQVGLTCGSLFSAALVDLTALDQSAAFFALSACFVACIAALTLCPETAARRPGALRSLAPRISVPAAVRSVLPACCLAFMMTWAIGGMYQASATDFSALCFRSDAALPSALVFALYMAPTAIGSSLSSKLTPERSQAAGLLAFAGMLWLLFAALRLQNPALLLAATLGAAIAQGIAYTGAMRRVLKRTPTEHNAGTLSAVTMVSYAGPALTNLVIGLFGSDWDVVTIVSGYAGIACLCFAATALLYRTATPRANPKTIQ